MTFRTSVLLVGLVAVAAFFAINWSVLAAPMHISLVAYSADLPVGVIVAGLLIAVVAVLAIYVALWQRRFLLDFRRQELQLQAHRSLADDAEASRFTQLQVFIAAEMKLLNQQVKSALDELRGEMQDNERSLAATLGEMDDRMQMSQTSLRQRE